jgi:hypothetical protein
MDFSFSEVAGLCTVHTLFAWCSQREHPSLSHIYTIALQPHTHISADTGTQPDNDSLMVRELKSLFGMVAEERRKGEPWRFVTGTE